MARQIVAVAALLLASCAPEGLSEAQISEINSAIASQSEQIDDAAMDAAADAIDDEVNPRLDDIEARLDDIEARLGIR